MAYTNTIVVVSDMASVEASTQGVTIMYGLKDFT